MIVFNGATGCMAEVSDEHRSSVHRVVSAAPGDPVDVSLLDPDLCSQLVGGGFLVHDDVDEREFLRQVLLAPRYSTDISYLCVVATTRCNFSCPYCIQDTAPGEDLHPEVEDRILEAIQNTRALSLSLTFYGGEPLLVAETCRRVASMARELCRQKKRVFNGFIVTNCYLLDGDTAQMLQQAGISRAQITIDGNREFHDSRRMTRSGMRTFDRIVRNVRAASRYLKIDVRMNIDGDVHLSSDNVRDVELEFEGNDSVNLYVAPARWRGDPSTSERNLRTVCRCFPHQSLVRARLEAGIPGCCAVSPGSRVILPNGDYVLCWDEVGTKHPDYGSILSSTCPLPARRADWMRWDPCLVEPCRSCRYLPTCRGNCPRDGLFSDSPSCPYKSDEEYRRFIMTNYLGRTSAGSPMHHGPVRQADTREDGQRMEVTG